MNEKPSSSPEGNFTLEAKTYVTYYKYLSADLVYFERVHSFSKCSNELDAFSNFSLLCLLPPGQRVGIRRNGKVLDFYGPAYFYVPQFSLIEWDISPGVLQWSAYMTKSLFPQKVGAEAIGFRLAEFQPAITVEDVFGQIRHATHVEKISKEELSTAVAVRTKKYIDQNFTQDLDITQVSKDLGYSPAVMSRYFKKCYGIPPVEYRKRLRIFGSTADLLFSDQHIHEVAAQVGYEDLSRFNKNFSKVMSVSPSKFRPSAVQNRNPESLKPYLAPEVNL